MKRWILWTVLLLVAGLGGGAWWVYRSSDRLIADAIRNYGPRMTGVAIKLGSVHLAPGSGFAELKGLELGNPPGYQTPRAIELGEISLRLEVASLTADTVRVRELRIVAPRITYERGNGGSNLEVIERNVQSFVAAQNAAARGAAGGEKDAKSSGAPAQNPASQKKLIIDDLYIQGANAEVSATPLQGRTITVPVADIHLHGVGEKSGGATPAEVTSAVVSAVTRSVIQSVTRASATGVVNGIKNGAKAAVDAVKGLFK